MKLFATVTFLLFVSSVYSQTQVRTDSILLMDTLKVVDSLKSVNGTPTPAPDALGNCIMLPGDLDHSGTCWKRCH